MLAARVVTQDAGVVRGGEGRWLLTGMWVSSRVCCGWLATECIFCLKQPHDCANRSSLPGTCAGGGGQRADGQGTAGQRPAAPARHNHPAQQVSRGIGTVGGRRQVALQQSSGCVVSFAVLQGGQAVGSSSRSPISPNPPMLTSRRVSARDIPPQAVAAARRLAGDKAQPALELVSSGHCRWRPTV